MKKSIIIAILILMLVIGWFLSGYLYNNDIRENQSTSSDKKEQKIIDSEIENFKVESILSNSKKIDQSITIQGQTIEYRHINLKSETTGNIIKKNFTRGTKVNLGDILAEISIEDREELLNSLNKEFERINKEIILIKKRRDNNILKTQEQINLYQLEYNSAKELLNKGLGSESKLSLASFNLTQAKTNLKEIDINFQSESINLESLLESTKSRIKNIQIDIENTKVLSPFEGIIESSNIELGTFVRPGDIIARIVDLNPIKIQGYLSETDINKIQLGTEADIKISNSLKKIGKITFISPVAEKNTRTFEFIIEADNEDLLFKSGLTTTINIEVSSINAHKISPSILTLQEDGTVGVKAIDNNKVIFYPIEKVNDTIDGMWVTGLPDQVKIIITGQEYVTVGQILQTE